MKSDSGCGDDAILLLPRELWRDIVSRLPVKSILRFRSVCKSWYSLISCPNFVSDYSNKNKNGKRVLVQYLEHPMESYDESFMESYDYEPDIFGFRGPKIVGSCDGLILLRNQLDSGVQRADFVLWNPAVRKIVELPCRTCLRGGDCFSYFGFGFDPKIRDYKVLCAVRDESSHFPNHVSLCEIYDLSKGVWRAIDPLVTSLWPCKRGQECYLDGAVHWIAYNCIVKKNVLLSFDMSDEIWIELSLPDSAEFTLDRDDQRWDVVCGTFDGLIYLIRWKDRMAEICSFWVMKEYGVTKSWTKLFNIDMQSSPAFSGASPHKFLLWKNGQVLVVHHQEVRIDDDGIFVGEQEFSLYDGESKICKRIFSSTKILIDRCLYEESLILM